MSAASGAATARASGRRCRPHGSGPGALRPTDALAAFFLPGVAYLAAGALAVVHVLTGWAPGRWLALHLAFWAASHSSCSARVSSSSGPFWPRSLLGAAGFGLSSGSGTRERSRSPRASCSASRRAPKSVRWPFSPRSAARSRGPPHAHASPDGDSALVALAAVGLAALAATQLLGLEAATAPAAAVLLAVDGLLAGRVLAPAARAARVVRPRV